MKAGTDVALWGNDLPDFDVPERPWKWTLLDYALILAAFVIVAVIGVWAS
jgi:hypothetical protein